jgi:hypothetical protein
VATTLADLVTKARFQSNMEANDFVTDLELTGYLNDNLGHLDDVLIGTYEDYKVTPVDVTISSSTDGTNYFSVPSDFLKLRAVWYSYAGGWVPLREFGLQDADVLASGTVVLPPIVRDLRFRLEDQKVWIEPYAAAPGTYRLRYVPKFTPLVGVYDAEGMFTGAGGTGVSLPAYMDTQGWHAFAVAGACELVQMKQDLDASVWAAKKEAERQRVILASKSRQAGPPKAMRDTRRRRMWPWGSPGGSLGG